MQLEPLFTLDLDQPVAQCRTRSLQAGGAGAMLIAYSADYDVDPYSEMFFFPTDTLKLAVAKHLDHDASCGNKQWFNPLTRVDRAEMGTTDANEFSGASLCTKWSDPNKRSSFFGTFSF